MLSDKALRDEIMARKPASVLAGPNGGNKWAIFAPDPRYRLNKDEAAKLRNTVRKMRVVARAGHTTPAQVILAMPPEVLPAVSSIIREGWRRGYATVQPTPTDVSLANEAPSLGNASRICWAMWNKLEAFDEEANGADADPYGDGTAPVTLH